MSELVSRLPKVEGRLLPQETLAPFTWFRVGGPADVLFLPADEDDLVRFLTQLPQDIPVQALGVGSNVIIRDGGVAGVVIRLAGRYWGEITEAGGFDLIARAGSLDLAVARQAAKLGFAGLEFLSGIPGTLGGAVPTNAGCYDRELKDVLVRLHGVRRNGERVTIEGPLGDLSKPSLHMSYRHTDIPGDVIVTALHLRAGGHDDPQAISDRIAGLQSRREASQPIREKTGGSTFANPDPPGTPDQRRAWKLIDEAGMRGARVGGAMVSDKHCNFLINTGEATAADIETLGEEVRAAVKAASGVDLRWEIRRIGRPA